MWLVLAGTCDGQAATPLDPLGGTTAFLVGGTVGMGKVFTFYKAETTETLEQTVNGRGVDSDRLVTCEFLIEDVPAPGGGTIDIRNYCRPTGRPRRPRAGSPPCVAGSSSSCHRGDPVHHGRHGGVNLWTVFSYYTLSRV